MKKPEENRFCGMLEEQVILTPAEAASPDRDNIIAEKRRLIAGGVSPLALVDLAVWRKAHPVAA